MDKENYYKLGGSGILCWYLPYLLALVAPYVYRLRDEGFSGIQVYQGMVTHKKHCPWIGYPPDITYLFELNQEEFRTVFGRVSYRKADESEVMC
jgi:hypothetical protein